jgi:hypothetical protein
MSENITVKRARFNHMFGMLTVYAGIKNIYFIHDTYGYARTAEVQNMLFKAGKSKCDGYKIISQHQRHLARDLYVISENGKIVWNEIPYKILGGYWEGLGGKWGGNFKDFKDNFHFELP